MRERYLIFAENVKRRVKGRQRWTLEVNWTTRSASGYNRRRGYCALDRLFYSSP